jgi:hypothetical protein
MRLAWEDGASAAFIGAGATPVAVLGQCDAVTHEVICQDGAAQR